jgi:hypothetical protein
MRAKVFVALIVILAAITFSQSASAAPVPPPSVVGQWTIVKGNLTAVVNVDMFACTTFPKCECDSYPECSGSNWAFKDLVDMTVKLPNLNVPCQFGLCDTFIFYGDNTFNDTIGLFANGQGVEIPVTWAQNKAAFVVNIPLQEMLTQLEDLKIYAKVDKYTFAGATSIGTVLGQKIPMIKGKLNLVVSFYDHLASETKSILKGAITITGAFEGWYTDEPPPLPEAAAQEAPAVAQDNVLNYGIQGQSLDSIIKDLILKSIPENFKK